MLATNVSHVSLFADLVEFVSTLHSGTKKFFTCSLEHNARNLLGEASKTQIIYETETLCGVLAHFLWLSIVHGRKSFLYVDNEGTKFSLIKGTSENDIVDLLVHIFAEHKILVSTLSWLSPVSSDSNIANVPSRGDSRLLDRLGFEDVSIEGRMHMFRSHTFFTGEKIGGKGRKLRVRQIPQ